MSPLVRIFETLFVLDDRSLTVVHPVATTRSPLQDLLAYPIPTQKNSKLKGCARVLTSAEPITFLEEKECKKQEELELEGKRKREREAKKALREEEKKRKAQQREEKKAQKQKMLD